MKETDCQRWIIDAAESVGGAGHKLSNRFLIGVADLLVKMPNVPPVLLEAKLQHIGMSTPSSHTFTLEVTKLQSHFLRKYADAGMACGVASFVERGRKGRRHVSMLLRRFDQIERDDFRVRVEDHHGPLSEDTIAALLTRAARTWT